MAVEVRKIDPESREDFYRLHCEENGMGWCFCVAWWVESWEGWGERGAGENRRLREELFDRGEWDGYLAYEEGEPVGWAQVGPRDRLSRLVGQFGLEPDPGAFAVTCFLVAPGRRRRGIARRLLKGILADLSSRGARTLEAFARKGGELDPLELWTGPESLLREMGFEPFGETSRTVLLRRDLPAAPRPRECP